MSTQDLKADQRGLLVVWWSARPQDRPTSQRREGADRRRSDRDHWLRRTPHVSLVALSAQGRAQRRGDERQRPRAHHDTNIAFTYGVPASKRCQSGG